MNNSAAGPHGQYDGLVGAAKDILELLFSEEHYPLNRPELLAAMAELHTALSDIEPTRAAPLSPS